MRSKALGDEALFLQSAKCLGADFEGDFFSVNGQCFSLEVWLPDFFGMTL